MCNEVRRPVRDVSGCGLCKANGPVTSKNIQRQEDGDGQTRHDKDIQEHKQFKSNVQEPLHARTESNLVLPRANGANNPHAVLKGEPEGGYVTE